MIIKAISAVLWKLRRRRFMREQSGKLKNRDFTIFSSNCIGGMLYHDLGLVFSSPFINLFLSCEDFIRFCESYETYLQQELLPAEEQGAYPIAKLGELTIHLVHYKSFAQAKAAWERRCKRINPNNLFLITTDRDGFTPELSERFDALPYRKVLLVHQPDNNPNHFYIKGYEDKEQVGDLIKKADPRNGKRIMDQYDWISFLNQNDMNIQKSEHTNVKAGAENVY